MKPLTFLSEAAKKSIFSQPTVTQPLPDLPRIPTNFSCMERHHSTPWRKDKQIFQSSLSRSFLSSMNLAHHKFSSCHHSEIPPNCLPCQDALESNKFTDEHRLSGSVKKSTSRIQNIFFTIGQMLASLVVHEHQCDLPKWPLCRRRVFTLKENLPFLLSSLCSVPQGCVSRTDLPFFNTANLLWLPPGFSHLSSLVLPPFHQPVIGVPSTWLYPIFVWVAAAAWILSPIFDFNSNTGNREKRRHCWYCC